MKNAATTVLRGLLTVLAGVSLNATAGEGTQAAPCTSTAGAAVAIVGAALQRDEAAVLRSIDAGADLKLCVSEREIRLLAEPKKHITYVGTPDPGYPLIVLLAVADMPKAVSALLERAPQQVHALDPYGNSALAWAARLAHTEVVRRLLDAGLDPLQGNDKRQTPLSLLVMSSEISAAKTETVQALIGKVPRSRFSSIGVVDMVWLSAYQWDFETTRVLLEAGVPPHYVAPQGRTALYSAVENANLAAVRLLLKYGARVSNTPYRGTSIFELAEAMKTRNPPDTVEIHRLIELEREALIALGHEPPGSSPEDWNPPRETLPR